MAAVPKIISAEILVLIACVFEGLFPIFVRVGSAAFPPVLFVAMSTCIAAVFLGTLAWTRGAFRERIPRAVYGYIAVVALCVMGGFAMISIGARQTSGINISLLLQTEMLFAFLLCNVVLGEKISVRVLAGMPLIFLGACAVLFNGSFTLNSGDAIILLAAAIFPIGNIFAKKALALTRPVIVLFLRYVFGSVFLFAVSAFMGEFLQWNLGILRVHGWLIVAYAVSVLTLSKLFWYTGLKTLPIGKATQIVGVAPVMGFCFSLLLLHEIPTVYQLIGLVVTVLGVFILVSKPSISTTEADLV